MEPRKEMKHVMMEIQMTETAVTASAGMRCVAMDMFKLVKLVMTGI